MVKITDIEVVGVATDKLEIGDYLVREKGAQGVRKMTPEEAEFFLSYDRENN